METNRDIRWIQRYDNYHRACGRLLEVTEGETSLADLSELEKEGLVQRFEYTLELAWKVLQDLMIYKGYDFMTGPNGTVKMAFEDGIISDHDGWRRMMNARNLMTHTYDEEDAAMVTEFIWTDFSALLKQLDSILGSLAEKEG